MTNNQATFATSGQYVNLPSGLFGSYKAVSVEAWVTTGVNIGWERIFQFGTSGNSNTNSTGVYRQNGPNSFGALWLDSTGSSVWNSSTSSILFDSQMNVHVVMTFDTRGYASLYINGTLQASTPAVVANPIPVPTVFYIGKAFDVEPGLIGSVNEFRIWGGALSASDITTRYSQGPGEANIGLAFNLVILHFRDISSDMTFVVISSDGLCKAGEYYSSSRSCMSVPAGNPLFILFIVSLFNL